MGLFRSRKPKGTPRRGGQFAAMSHSESEVSLAVHRSPASDSPERKAMLDTSDRIDLNMAAASLGAAQAYLVAAVRSESASTKKLNGLVVHVRQATAGVNAVVSQTTARNPFDAVPSGEDVCHAAFRSALGSRPGYHSAQTDLHVTGVDLDRSEQAHLSNPTRASASRRDRDSARHAAASIVMADHDAHRWDIGLL